MILPLALSLKPDGPAKTAAIEAHEQRVREFAQQVAHDIFKLFGAVQFPAGLEAAVEGYAFPMAMLLRHVDLLANKDRPRKIRESIMQAAARIAVKDRSRVPPVLNLLVNAHYALAYPGGVDLSRHADIYCLRMVNASLEGFHDARGHVLDWMVVTKQNIEHFTKLAELELKPNRGDVEEIILREMRERPPRVITSGYRTWEQWAREGPEGEARWSKFLTWFNAGSSACVLPDIPDREST